MADIGPGVKPIALHMVSSVANHPKVGIPFRASAGIGNWRDAVEVHAAGANLGAGLHRSDALWVPHRRGHDRRAEQFLVEKKMSSPMELVGKSVSRVQDWATST